MDRDEMIKTLEYASCDDPFECPVGMYGRNSDGHYGCFAQYPNGDPNEKDHGCFFHQVAKILKEQKSGRWIDHTLDGYPDLNTCECPFCHHEWNVIDNCTETFFYCPNCGAKLDDDERTPPIGKSVRE